MHIALLLIQEDQYFHSAESLKIPFETKKYG